MTRLTEEWLEQGNAILVSERRARTPAGQPPGRRRYKIERDGFEKRHG